MKILVLTQQHSGVGYHRLMLPTILMEGKERARITDTITEGLLDEGWDIVWLSRTWDKDDIFELRAKYGFKVIVDVDDYWILDAHHIMYDGYMDANYPTAIVRHLRKADLVTCTHERLAAMVQTYNDNILLCPNAIPYGNGQFHSDRFETEFVKFFWAGGITHREDLKLLKNPISKITGSVHFVIGGYTDSNETEIAHWKPMVDYFTNYGKQSNTIMRGRPISEYYDLYSAADVALIPLLKTMFNTYKSNLKILEAAGKKIPVVVSAVHPYLGFPEALVNYVRTEGDWLRHMERLRDSRELREQQGQALYEYCQQHYNFDEINKARESAFLSLLQPYK
jgi:glycosyltransferase involved in cell wall biosynthesis